ncbi:hypothetical protein [Chondromyces apiculatus]|uniref:Uncharacterized protein n=1 Tax=Chondromyces apiculatus DSM 436 TaxID=1192034 RepID=A0A017TEK7_9BACT|nr:hypothetical protein [Chondromyces apiculatus]EYF07260.1 Hypothetical protein CAP_0739 [Chondromyces apiculatus DSM 436]
MITRGPFRESSMEVSLDEQESASLREILHTIKGLCGGSWSAVDTLLVLGKGDAEKIWNGTYDATAEIAYRISKSTNLTMDDVVIGNRNGRCAHCKRPQPDPFTPQSPDDAPPEAKA